VVYNKAQGDDTSLSGSGVVYTGNADAVNQYASWLYFGWNPLLLPDGQRWVFDLSGFYASLTVSFFF